MNTRKIIAFALPLVGASVIVGTGFSAWYFGANATNSGEANGTVEVAPEFTGTWGNLNASSFKVTLDQGIPLSTTPTDDEKKSGVLVKTSSDTSTDLESIKVTYTLPKKSVDAIKSGDIEIKLKATLVLNGDVNTYVGVNTSSNVAFTGGTTEPSSYTYDKTFGSGTADASGTTYVAQSAVIDSAALSSVSLSGPSDNYMYYCSINTQTNESTKVNSLLVYKDNQKPDDSTALAAMNTAISGSTVKVSFSVEVINK